MTKPGVSPRTVASRMIAGRDDPEILEKGDALLREVKTLIEARRPRNYMELVSAIETFRERIRAATPKEELQKLARNIHGANIAVESEVDNLFLRGCMSDYATGKLPGPMTAAKFKN